MGVRAFAQKPRSGIIKYAMHAKKKLLKGKKYIGALLDGSANTARDVKKMKKTLEKQKKKLAGLGGGVDKMGLTTKKYMEKRIHIYMVDGIFILG